jgi:hypothetical protein
MNTLKLTVTQWENNYKTPNSKGGMGTIIKHPTANITLTRHTHNFIQKRSGWHRTSCANTLPAGVQVYYRQQITMATKFCTVVPNICGSSAWNLFHVTLLAPIILTWLLNVLWKFSNTWLTVFYITELLPIQSGWHGCCIVTSALKCSVWQ